MIIAASGCLALGWWQWTRFESAAGTFQNLGYALQWPFFAGFCVYAYRKFVRLESAPESAGASAADRADGPTEIPEGLLPERPAARPADTVPDADADLQQYNAYLAELARKDKQDRTTA